MRTPLHLVAFSATFGANFAETTEGQRSADSLLYTSVVSDCSLDLSSIIKFGFSLSLNRRVTTSPIQQNLPSAGRVDHLEWQQISDDTLFENKGLQQSSPEKVSFH